MLNSIQQIATANEGFLQEFLPVLPKIGISYFSFAKKIENKFIIRLSTLAKWVETYFENGFDAVNPFEMPFNLYQRGWVFWFELRQDPIFSTLAKQFNVGHGITLIRPVHNSCEFYSFGTDLSNEKIIPEYLNYMNDFENFILYFKEKGQSVVAKCIKQQGTENNIKTNNVKKIIDHSDLYHNYLEGNDIYLSAQELTMLNILSLGKTADEAAAILNLSKRTAEYYIGKLKKKFNCDSLFQLGFKSKKYLTSKF